MTTGELLRSEDVETSFDITDSSADTKVKTAVAWLERGGYLVRNHNSNQVFNGKPLFASLEEAKGKLDSLQLSNRARRNWELLLQVLINSDIDEGLNADILAHRMGSLAGEREARRLDSQEVIRILNQMAQAGVRVRRPAHDRLPAPQGHQGGTARIRGGLPDRARNGGIAGGRASRRRS